MGGTDDPGRKAELIAVAAVIGGKGRKIGDPPV
jgi:hypothetical protein